MKTSHRARGSRVPWRRHQGRGRVCGESLEPRETVQAGRLPLGRSHGVDSRGRLPCRPGTCGEAGPGCSSLPQSLALTIRPGFLQLKPQTGKLPAPRGREPKEEASPGSIWLP